MAVLYEFAPLNLLCFFNFSLGLVFFLSLLLCCFCLLVVFFLINKSKFWATTSTAQHPIRKKQRTGAVTAFSRSNFTAVTHTRTFVDLHIVSRGGAQMPLRRPQALTHRSAPVEGGLQGGSARRDPAVCQGPGPGPWG